MLVPEEVILKYFQLPEEVVEEMRQVAKTNNLDWLEYLNQLYREFQF